MLSFIAIAATCERNQNLFSIHNYVRVNNPTRLRISSFPHIMPSDTPAFSLKRVLLFHLSSALYYFRVMNYSYIANFKFFYIYDQSYCPFILNCFMNFTHYVDFFLSKLFLRKSKYLSNLFYLLMHAFISERAP